MKGRRNGFTLVELLVVIAIMSILTVITVSQFQSARKKARDVQRKADISSLAKALEMYYADYGYFPTSDGEGRIYVNDNTVAWGGEFRDSAGYIYMKNIPQENYLSIPYCYAVTADQKMMGVFTALENDQDADYNRQDAERDNYICNGNDDYNFVIMSPNAGLGDIPTD